MIDEARMMNDSGTNETAIRQTVHPVYDSNDELAAIFSTAERAEAFCAQYRTYYYAGEMVLDDEPFWKGTA